MSDELGRVRQMWHLLEPLHAVLYYAPEAFEEAAALGYAVDERWPSYFAWRAAPLGEEGAGVGRVAETFYSFSPAMVDEYVPAVWSVASPDAVLAARGRAVDRAYRTILGEAATAPDTAEAAALVRRVAEAADTTGRPLAAANAALPWPDAPHLVLWHAATVLREHRGDGHLAALADAELDPVEALVSFAAIGAARPEVFAKPALERRGLDARPRTAAEARPGGGRRHGDGGGQGAARRGRAAHGRGGGRAVADAAGRGAGAARGAAGPVVGGGDRLRAAADGDDAGHRQGVIRAASGVTGCHEHSLTGQTSVGFPGWFGFLPVRTASSDISPRLSSDRARPGRGGRTGPDRL